MMTEVCIEKVCIAKFECDTAASHNVISAELCRKLRQKKIIPGVKTERVAIRLADGTVSRKLCGSISLSVKANNSPTVKLNFFVLEGPNNLLDRLALEKLWPQQYEALKKVVTAQEATVMAADMVSTKSVKSSGSGVEQQK